MRGSLGGSHVLADFIAICHYLLMSLLIQQLGSPLNGVLWTERVTESGVHGYYAHFSEKQLMPREEKQ